MSAFTMRVANTCSACGQMIQAGEQVFAANDDEVRSGLGTCGACPSGEPAEPAVKDYAGFNATLAAEKLAAIEGIDLAGVQGTGSKGKITKSDVEAMVDDGV